MTNFKKQKRLCQNCRKVWFTPLFEAHWVHCVGGEPLSFWEAWKQEHPEYSAQAEKEEMDL
jgi:hypothetical protein